MRCVFHKLFDDPLSVICMTQLEKYFQQMQGSMAYIAYSCAKSVNKGRIAVFYRDISEVLATIRMGWVKFKGKNQAS